jgi:hypothetical protein
MVDPPERARPLRARTRPMRELGPLVLLLCACGAAVHQGVPLPAEAAAAAASAFPAVEGPASAESTAAFEALVARAAEAAPGMHEAARKETSGELVDLVRADARDTCVRVAFEATAPVTASLVDRAGETLATGESGATSGLLGARGPVCVRKGDVVRAATEGSGARVRWLAWEAR